MTFVFLSPGKLLILQQENYQIMDRNMDSYYGILYSRFGVWTLLTSGIECDEVDECDWVTSKITYKFESVILITKIPSDTDKNDKKCYRCYKHLAYWLNTQINC